MTKQPTIGILSQATSIYAQYVPQFIKSVQQNFCPGYKKKVYLFTDRPHAGAFNVLIPHKRFPFITLERFDTFWMHREHYEHEDFLFYMDIDMTVKHAPAEDFLFDKNGNWNKLIAVKHPLFEDGKGTWEQRTKSEAYVPAELRKIYFCGGVQGGTDYLKLCEVLAEKVKADLRRGVIAVWHDESHFNQHLAFNNGYKILPRDYCYPEEMTLPFKRNIVALKKSKEFLKKVR